MKLAITRTRLQSGLKIPETKLEIFNLSKLSEKAYEIRNEFKLKLKSELVRTQ